MPWDNTRLTDLCNLTKRCIVSSTDQLRIINIGTHSNLLDFLSRLYCFLIYQLPKNNFELFALVNRIRLIRALDFLG